MKKLIAFISMFLMLSLTVMPVAAKKPVERQLPRLVDEGDLLTDAEEEELLSKLDEISERQQCDVVVATVNTLGYKASQAYADDFFDDNGYGMGEDRAGIILLICMENRDYALSTSGYGITAFTDYGLQYLEKQFIPDLSAGNYSVSFGTYADVCDSLLTQARNGVPFDIQTRQVERAPRPLTAGVIVVRLMIACLVGFMIALGIATGKRSALKSVRKERLAGDYMTNFNLLTKNDRFVNSITTHNTVSKASSQGGGSTVHTSSSGSFHGGSSGKF